MRRRKQGSRTTKPQCPLHFSAMESLGGGGVGGRSRQRERERAGKKAHSVLVFNVRHCAPVCARVCVVVQASTQSVGKAGGASEKVRVLSQWLLSVVDFLSYTACFHGASQCCIALMGWGGGGEGAIVKLWMEWRHRRQ